MHSRNPRVLLRPTTHINTNWSIGDGLVCLIQTQLYNMIKATVYGENAPAGGLFLDNLNGLQPSIPRHKVLFTLLAGLGLCFDAGIGPPPPLALMLYHRFLFLMRPGLLHGPLYPIDGALELVDRQIFQSLLETRRKGSLPASQPD